MASVIVNADLVKQAVSKTREELRPGPNHIRTAWPEQEAMLQEIDHVARRAEAVRVDGAPALVGLSQREFELIAHNLSDGGPRGA